MFVLVCPVLAATASDNVQIRLLVDNGTSSSATSTATSTNTSSVSTSFFANGAPLGPLSPAVDQSTSPPLLDGNVLVTPPLRFGEPAVFQWKTTAPTSAVVEWGETRAYELGSQRISIDTAQNIGIFGYLYRHQAEGLLPGKTYLYRVTVRSENGRVDGYQGAYVVPIVVQRLLPENVSNISLEPLVTPSGRQLLIRWENPEEDQFSEVRVVRSPFGFPNDPLDGKVVYEGRAERALDFLDAADDQTYFYTIFARRADGTYSSGAVAVASGSESVRTVSEVPSRATQSVAEFATLTAEDFSVIVYDADGGEKIYPLSRAGLSVSAGEKITLSAPYTAFPEVLKTILVHITPNTVSPDVTPGAGGPAKSTMSFLLRVNASGTAYEATFLAPGKVGGHDVEVKILDYHSDILRNISVKNALEVKKAEMNFQNVLKNAKSQFEIVEKPFVLAIFIVLILLTLALRKIVRFF